MQPPRFHVGANDVAILYPTCPTPEPEPLAVPVGCVPLGAPPMADRPTCSPPAPVRALVVVRNRHVADVLLIHARW
jgi:hypothetical protein